MYFNKGKKYANIMPYVKDGVIYKYAILKTDSMTLGWDTICEIDIIENENGDRFIDEKMIRIIRQLIYNGYEILGKKEKNNL